MYIFLDFDGVLYTSTYNLLLNSENKKDKDKFGYLFDPKCIQNLNKIVDECDAKIIISSTWRQNGLDYLNGLFKHRKIEGEIVGVTPLGTIDKLFFSRCEEISSYIKTNNVKEYIIIDDNISEDDFCYKDVYQTSMKHGLTDDITKQIIKNYEQRN